MKTELNARMINFITTISIAYEEHCIFLVGVGSQPNRNYENNVKWKKQELIGIFLCVYVSELCSCVEMNENLTEFFHVLVWRINYVCMMYFSGI